METNVGNIISNHEKQLINYLTNQAADTLDEIKLMEKSLENLTEGDDTFTKVLDDIIQMKINDMSVLKFRLAWLQSQLKTIISLNK
jgi:hypothetical protein